MRLRAIAFLAALSTALPAQESPIARAEDLLGQRKYAAAEAALREILAADPSSARAHGNLALALLWQGKTREAIDEGRLAAAFGPEHPEARYIYGMTLAAGGRPLEAARELEKAVAARPGVVGPLSALAGAYAAAGDARAAAAYEKLIALEPAVPEHRTALAEHLWSAGNLAEGNRVAEAAIAAFPENAGLPLRYGRALVQQERFLDAAARLETARGLGASGEAFLLLLGSAYRQGGRPEEAERVLSAAARDYPVSVGARSDLGRLLLSSGRVDEALPELEAAARLDPRAAGLQLDLGRACETLGKLDEAEAAYRRAVRLAPNLPRAHYALGRLLLRRGNRAEAEAELAIHRRLYDRGLKLVSEAEARAGELDLARARLQEGKAAEALALFAALPESTDSLVGRAKALSSLGRHAEAARVLERARYLDPEDKRIEPMLAAERSRGAESK